MESRKKVFKPLIVALAIGLALLVAMMMPGESRAEQVPYSDFVAAVERGDVRSVRIQEQVIEGQRQDFSSISTYAPEGADLIPVLREHGVEIVAVPPPSNMFGAIVGGLLPILLLLAIFFFIARRMRGGGAGGGAGGLMSVGKSKAKLLTEAHGRVTFEDVAGIDEAKDDLMEIVEFLRDPQKFQRLGGRIPRGVLLVGPPGTGKTLTARAAPAHAPCNEEEDREEQQDRQEAADDRAEHGAGRGHRDDLDAVLAQHRDQIGAFGC
ncbi:MAG TPA: ATP-dependent metallopeptidase FtsH/Yme1/Tma family protein, partial [Saliniramus sp.]|nr:ATP-dependent metallopeptidase FtsH/Yme1/Tma family protein [Saliniramus sp.]